MFRGMIRCGVVASRRSGRARAALLAAGLLLGAGNSCTTNHDALAKQPRAGSQSGGGGSSGCGSGGFGNTGTVSQGGRINPDVEPAGDDVLTIVNGVVDAPSVRLCFSSVVDTGEPAELVGSPMPELAYAASVV